MVARDLGIRKRNFILIFFTVLASLFLQTVMVDSGNALTAPKSIADKAFFSSAYSKELSAYKAKIAKLAPAETYIVNGWASVSGTNYKDDLTMYNKLKVILPKVNSFIASIEAIQPNNSKIYAAHQLYVDGWNLQFQAFTLTLAALENQDYAQVTQANSYLSQGRSKINLYIRKLKTL